MRAEPLGRSAPRLNIRRGPESAAGHASLIRGYAWHAYPDPATPGVFAGDTPFGTDDAPGLDRAPFSPPPGVVACWQVGKNTPGVLQATDGHTYLILTEALHPPAVAAGWSVEPARLTQEFQLDQRGDRTVLLIRFLDTAETTLGAVKHCEFQVDRG